jgi:hypothetical protein
MEIAEALADRIISALGLEYDLTLRPLVIEYYSRNDLVIIPEPFEGISKYLPPQVDGPPQSQ